MKEIFLCLSTLFICFALHAQCDSIFALKKMETPLASFMHSPEGSLWWDGNTAQAIINDPNLSSAPASAACLGELWYGAYDQNGTLYLRANDYGLSTNASAFSPGPITANLSDPAICKLFNRIWEVKKNEINNHQSDWEDNQNIDGPIPENILLWPGHRNKFIYQAYGAALPDIPLAPFYDRNQNGQYEPDLGDYPDIRGANIAHWWIFNDTGQNAQSQVGIPTADFAVLAYSYDDVQSSTTTFYYEYLMTNRSQIDFAEMRLALYIRLQLGCLFDDYLGCLPDKNLAFVYNDDVIDGQYGNSCPWGVQTFDLNIPLFGIKILDGTDSWDANLDWIDNGMSSFMYCNNNGHGPPGTFDPQNANEYWNYMQGIWRDGMPLTFGGQGYDPAISDTTKYAFPDATNDPNGWSMCTSALGPGNRSIIINSGPFTLAPGESQKFAFAAIVTGAIDDYPCPSIDPLVEAADAAQEVYDNLISTTKGPSNALDLTIFPNPTTDILNIKWDRQDLNELRIYDSQGKLIQTKKLDQQINEQFSMQQLADGLYLFSFSDANGKFYIRKVIKN